MSRSEKSIAVPTGMIIAALYVVLLVGFSRESYMRRDAMARAETIRWPTLQNVSNQACRIGQQNCEVLSAKATERQDCSAARDELSQLAGRSGHPLTAQNVLQALGAAR
jgi:hypothetical protein